MSLASIDPVSFGTKTGIEGDVGCSQGKEYAHKSKAKPEKSVHSGMGSKWNNDQSRENNGRGEGVCD
jgi:hypothetical protein